MDTMPPEKLFVDANSLLVDSFSLAKKIYNSGFKPTCFLAIWRGGSPIAIAVHEFLRFKGVHPFHAVIKTESYAGTVQKEFVVVEGMEKVSEKLSSSDNVLIVDDIFDTGKTAKSIIEELYKKTGTAKPEVRVATVFFKPAQNQTDIEPDYFIRETDSWVVFPHEIEGLTCAELKKKDHALFNVICEKQTLGK